MIATRARASRRLRQILFTAALSICVTCIAGSGRAEDRALVLDSKGQTLLAIDLNSGTVLGRTPVAETSSLVLRSSDGSRLAVIDPGPQKATICCHFQPKGPMSAALLDSASLAPVGTVALGWGLPSYERFSFDIPALESFSAPDPDGRRVTLLAAGYHSKKPEETLPRELVTLDIAAGKVVGRMALDRDMDAMWRAGDGNTIVLFAAATRGKEPLPAEVLFADLAQGSVAQRVRLSGAPVQWLMSPAGDWLYLLEPGEPSNKSEKNVNGALTIVSVAERREVARLDAGSKPRGLTWDESRRVVLLPSDGAPVDKGQTRAGELRIFSGPAQTALVNVAEQPHMVRLNGTRAYVFGKRALSIVELDGMRALPEIAVDDADDVSELTFSKDGARAFATYEASSRLSIFDLKSPRMVGSVTTGRGGVKFAKALGAAALSVAASTASYYQGRSMAMTQGRSWYTYNIYNFGVAAPESSVVVRPDGKLAYALNTQSNDVTVIDVPTASVVSKEAAKGRTLVLFPDGARIAVLGKDELRFFDTQTQLAGEPLRFEDAMRVSLRFTSDGRTAVAYGGKGLYVIDVKTGTVRAQVPGLLHVDSVLFDGAPASER